MYGSLNSPLVTPHNWLCVDMADSEIFHQSGMSPRSLARRINSRDGLPLEQRRQQCNTADE
jgi:hypothetical protein